MDQHPDYQVHARAEVSFPGGVPTYVVGAAVRGFNTAIAPIDNGGLGDTTLTLDHEIPADADVMVRVQAPIAASGLIAAGVVIVTSTTLRITTGQEGGGGAASALADLPFTVVVFACPAVMPL